MLGAIPPGNVFTEVAFFVVLFVVFYFGFSRANRSARAVAPGTEVTTDAGLVGKVVALEGETVTVELASGVQVKVQRQHLRR